MKDFLFKLPEDDEILRKRLSPRKRLLDSSLIADITAIFNNVAASGDNAVIEATEKFDNIIINAINVSDEYITRCLADLSPPFRTAVEKTIQNIKEVNEALMPDPDWRKEIRPGTVIGEKITPLDSVGLYIPARKGPLVSTALMLVTAAKVAGVSNIVVGMPPQENGQANPSTIAAASIAGADRIVMGNGVAVLAGMTTGTESIPEVDGMFGPGPAGIAAAMSVAFSHGKKTVVGIGPTDCAVIADDSAEPDWIARNLMCEAEHGPDSSVLLATTSEELAKKVVRTLFDRIPGVDNKKRGPVLSKVFGKDGMGAIAIVPDIKSACKIIDEFAPEHLMVACSEDTQVKVLSIIRNTGEILLGHNTPFSAANYAIGITAVLPTNGFARAFSGITCRDMIKTSTIGALSEDALKELKDTIKALGEHEGLPCHVEAALK
ncbi:MAG: histidinol dehydrogenase [Desulfobacteraceae bacterium]|jgi:histidinol dehydrogenase